MDSIKVPNSKDGAFYDVCNGVVEVEKYSMCDDECVMVWSKLRNICSMCDDECVMVNVMMFVIVV